MLKVVYCGLALGLLAAMAWAKPPAPRAKPCGAASLRAITWAVAQGQLTVGRAANLADATAGCVKHPEAARRGAPAARRRGAVIPPVQPDPKASRATQPESPSRR